LVVHKITFTNLKVSQFLNGQADVPERRGYPEKEEYDGQPRIGLKFFIKVFAKTVSNENGEGNLQP
jgi:hypothetical protein